ncbi:hypothetical protein GCM10020229_50490 [Kitasatospora albolonga]
MTLRQNAMASAGAAVAVISGAESEMPVIETASSTRSVLGSTARAGAAAGAWAAVTVSDRAAGTVLLGVVLRVVLGFRLLP